MSGGFIDCLGELNWSAGCDILLRILLFVLLPLFDELLEDERWETVVCLLVSETTVLGVRFSYRFFRVASPGSLYLSLSSDLGSSSRFFFPIVCLYFNSSFRSYSLGRSGR